MSAAFNHSDQNLGMPAKTEHTERHAVFEADAPHFKPKSPPPLDETVDRDGEGGMHVGNDDPWDVFIPDEDDLDPLPEPGDFWIEPDE